MFVTEKEMREGPS